MSTGHSHSIRSASIPCVPPAFRLLLPEIRLVLFLPYYLVCSIIFLRQTMFSKFNRNRRPRRNPSIHLTSPLVNQEHTDQQICSIGQVNRAIDALIRQAVDADVRFPASSSAVQVRVRDKDNSSIIIPVSYTHLTLPTILLV